MLSKAQNKYIRSLTHQKYRKEHQAFIAEGDKIAKEWLNSTWQVQMIICLQQWADENAVAIALHSEAKLYIVTEERLAAISALQAPNHALLVVNMPEEHAALPDKGWCIALDDLQDPGNMGTMIRIADWFGIQHILCSPGCVDVYNTKVVQAAMGGHLRVQVHKTDLANFTASTSLPVLAAVLNGESAYTAGRQPEGVLVIGNESKGVSAEVLKMATKVITIPGKGNAESLNAGVAAGILCALLLPC